MRRRLYFLLPDVKTAKAVFKKLLLARIEQQHVFFLARKGIALSDLPEATMLQKAMKSTVLPWAWSWAEPPGHSPASSP